MMALKNWNPNLDASGEDGDFDSQESEVLHWSDFAEDLGLPHPGSGYDP